MLIGDGKTGDGTNFGIFKQNWFILRIVFLFLISRLRYIMLYGNQMIGGLTSPASQSPNHGQEVVAAGGNTRDLAIAMLETSVPLSSDSHIALYTAIFLNSVTGDESTAGTSAMTPTMERSCILRCKRAPKLLLASERASRRWLLLAATPVIWRLRCWRRQSPYHLTRSEASNNLGASIISPDRNFLEFCHRG
jgi:hypothetical protein